MGEQEEGFVAWEEHILCHERGSRVVHYFLKQQCGDLVLAVVGTERSIRHMMYVVSDDFVNAFGPRGSVNACTKWRARREVVEWLSSLVSTPHTPDLPSSLTNNSILASGFSAQQNILFDQMSSRKFKFQSSKIEWSGPAWICAKQLRHYPAFFRNETTIMVHSFVFIMALDDHQYLGYLEDMYEDKKGKKKVKVRWFHHNQEVKDVIPQLNPHPREVFITPNVQVISAECIDGPAIVLTPKHYEKCMADVGHNTSSGIHMCFRQFKNHKLRPFTLAKLRGYANQAIIASLDSDVVPKQKAKSNKLGEEYESNGDIVKVGSKRNRSHERVGLEKDGFPVRNLDAGNQLAKSEPTCTKLKFKLAGKSTEAQAARPEFQLPMCFKVGDKIEMLCQDSGVRGCWFQCKILKISPNLLKVQYEDVEDADGLGQLVEWVTVHKVAAPDKLGMRCSGRLTTRPCPLKSLTNFTIEIGTPVDAWWCDGWWEGVVTGVGISGTDSVQVYFPGEGRCSIFQKRALRASKDWVGGEWVDIKARPDILSYMAGDTYSNKKLTTVTAVLPGPELNRTPESEILDEGGQGLHVLAVTVDGLNIAKPIISRSGPLITDKVEGNNFSSSDDADIGNEDTSGRNGGLCPIYKKNEVAVNKDSAV